MAQEKNQRYNIEQVFLKINDQLEHTFNSKNIKDYLNICSKFPKYSVNNQMLIMVQNPEATQLKSFNQWKNNDISIKKGEKAIQILAPSTYTKTIQQPILNENGEKVLDEAGNVQYESVDKQMKGYSLVNVFDKSQTNDTYHKTPIEELSHSKLGAASLINALKEYCSYPIEYDTSKNEKDVVVSIVDDFSVHLISDTSKKFTLEEKDIMANFISYAICKHFEVDVSGFDFSDMDSYIDNLKHTNGQGVVVPNEARYKELLMEVQKKVSSTLESLDPLFIKSFAKERVYDIAENTAYFMEAYDYYNISDSIEGATDREVHKNTVNEIYNQLMNPEAHQEILDYFDSFDDDSLSFSLEKASTIGEVKNAMYLVTNYFDEINFSIPKEKTISIDDVMSLNKQEFENEMAQANDKEPNNVENLSNSIKKLSPVQEEYFKDSKIRDDDGSLQVFYHATNSKFNAFDKSYIGSSHGDSFGEGFYFAAEPIPSYGENIPVYLDVKNPYVLDLNDEENLKDFAQKNNIEYSNLKEWIRWTASVKSGINKALKEDNARDLQGLKDKGYDGLVILNSSVGLYDQPKQDISKEVVVFEPNQIKSINNLYPTKSPVFTDNEEDYKKSLNINPQKKSVQKSPSKKESDIEDFGEKIGGAKKDLWKARGLLQSDIDEMNAAEIDKYLKKDNVWLKPDYQKLVDEGLDVRVAYFYKRVRDSLPTKPFILGRTMSEEEKKENISRYLNFVSELRDETLKCKTLDDIKGFFDNVIIGKGFLTHGENSYYLSQTDKSKHLLENKQLKAFRVSGSTIRSMEREIEKKKFCFTEEQKLLQGISFMQYNSDTHKFEKDYNDRVMISVDVPLGTKYIYPEKEYQDPSAFKEGSYYILNSYNKLLGLNFESQEKAKEFALSLMKEKQSIENEHTKQRKKSLIPEQLKEIRRIGNPVRENNIVGEDFLNDFKIKGGEFGNWLNDKDRQASMNFAYEAFKDLALALNIQDSDIGLNNNLSIAFGARGSGSALAHYEPLREVINLTKMKGAGSLAHEFFHALDDRIGKELGSNKFITESSKAPESVKKFVETLNLRTATKEEAIENENKKILNLENTFSRMIKSEFSKNMDESYNQKVDDFIKDFMLKAKERPLEAKDFKEFEEFKRKTTGHNLSVESRMTLEFQSSMIHNRYEAIKKIELGECDMPTRRSDFYENSIIIDHNFSKAGHGYWQSTIEMAARAFACYVDDKLKDLGMRNDYLTGHSELAIAPVPKKDGGIEIIKAFPVGEERKAINKAFDEMIKDFKKMGILHERELPKQITKDIEEPKKEKKQTKSKGIKI